MPPDMAYLRLISNVFYKTSVCCSPSLKAKDFRSMGGTFGRRPLTGEGGEGSDLNGQMQLKNMKIESQWPLILDLMLATVDSK